MHWKLSSKLDKLVVREPSLPVRRSVLVFWERTQTASPEQSDAQADVVVTACRSLLESGVQYDEVLAIGPVPMMKFVCRTTQPFGVHTMVSLNPIMVDGTGMCGGCRVTVGGETKFACVDGPDFDGHLVDFDEAIMRSRMYKAEEKLSDEKHFCHLIGGER